MDVGVFGYVRNEEGRVLLVRDASRQQLWTLPGGGLEFQELVPDAIVREIKEEAGIEVEAGRLLGIFSQQKTPGIVILMEARHVSGTPTPDGIEASDCRFFSLDELLAIRDEVKPAQLSMIAQVSAASEFPIFNGFPAPAS